MYYITQHMYYIFYTIRTLAIKVVPPLPLVVLCVFFIPNLGTCFICVIVCLSLVRVGSWYTKYSPCSV